MSDVTVRQLAGVLNMPVDKLLTQLSEAGMKFSGPDQIVTSTEKVKLLGFLRRNHGKQEAAVEAEQTGPSKITLRRKSVSELQLGGTAKGKTVAVEVRQKKTYVKRSSVNENEAVDPEREEAMRLVKESQARRDAEDSALREADAKRRAAEEAKRAAEEAARREAEAEARAAQPAVEPETAKEAPSAPTPEPRREERQDVRRDERRDDRTAPPRDNILRRPPGSPPRSDSRPGGPRPGGPGAGPRPSGPGGPRPGGPGMGPRPSGPSGPRPSGPGGPRPAGPGGPRPPMGARPGMGTAPPAPGAARPSGANKGSRNDRNSRDGDEQHRHKGNRGSHRMQDNDIAPEEISTLGRYLHGELHLGEHGPRRSRRKSKNRADQSRVAVGEHTFNKPVAPIKHEVQIGDSIQVGELAARMAIKSGDVIKTLMKLGVMATINQILDHDTAVLVVEELGHLAVAEQSNDAESTLLAQTDADAGTKVTRPPVVTIMGHVDHGKTSLLDYIRRTKVAAGEAGGITQHIGAYHVETPKGVVSFLDTPGHAAFTQMRARGAKLTDIVVLVVAADDGVMPQTQEAVQHAKAANVPLIVAVNKMDKSDADPDRVKQGLVQVEVVPEEWGGDTMFVPVSAKTGMGIDNLLDAILVQAEVLELTAVPDGRAAGTVIESALDKGRGPVATILVQKGTLNKGDYIVCGTQYGRVRAMFDESGNQSQSAGPSIPVQILGLSGVPDAGDDFVVVEDERLAKDVAQQREMKRREQRLVKQASTNLGDFMSQMAQAGSDQRTLNLVVKADVQGSSEALRESLTRLSTDQIKINVIGSGVGGITESDATLAAASKAVIIGFNVRTDASARKIVNDAGLDVRYFSIIYDVIDQVKQVASGLLGKEIREEIIGVAEVRDVFRNSKFGSIAGCMVTEGQVKRNKPVRVLRDNVVIFQGELDSLRRFKEAVEEVRGGMECGIGVKNYNDVKTGDQIECFERIEVQRTL